jgi:PAS domain S-box-containing protein
MTADDKVNILLVDDQPAKLLSYEVILRDLGENLLKANSAQEAFAHLLKTNVAVVLVDVFMPDLDGFELARMMREHPRFQKTAIIFISAVLLTDLDFLRGYRYGAVDYISVPVIPEILRAKVKVFAELFRKTEQLERLNRELEERVVERTAALEASTVELRKSEERLQLAFEAAQMGWWDYDIGGDQVTWSQSLIRLMGCSPQSFGATLEGALKYVHPDDRQRFLSLVRDGMNEGRGGSCELRFIRPDGSTRWSLAAGQVIRDGSGRPTHFAGVDLDITARKQAEERQQMLVRELDHRAKNLLAVVQSVLHLSHAETMPEFIASVDGRIRSLSRAHSLLSEARWQNVDLRRIVAEEIAPFSANPQQQIAAEGPAVSLHPASAQSLALALHELVTNAVKYGALSVPQGRVALSWTLQPEALLLRWIETGGPAVRTPKRKGFGTRVIGASIERQLRGRATFDWQPEGLQCSLTIPRSNFEAAPRIHVGDPEVEPADDAPPAIPVNGRRILLVEDEALVGIMMKDVLSDLGFGVVGPITSMTRALAVAREANISGAILDINLSGEPIYPVAEVLTLRAIPFVFVTGYSADSIDGRYAHIHTLEKPIEPETLRLLFVQEAGTFGLPRRPSEDVASIQ